ncbi:gfo/Idh/MocA family oxidoreductase [candidate division KSB1 bacterium]|nr:MAG: gfo/Idh/MocA family oxidoreductase [candidate division KSB1 bacterium]
MNNLRVGLAGAGYLGNIHARILASQKIQWTGIYDLDSARCTQVAAQYNTRAIASLDELIAQSDALVVAAATSAHYAIGKQVLSAGKHLFLEKPITTTPAEGEELVNLARSKKLVLQVGHVERFSRAFRALGSDHPRPQFIEAHRLSQFRPRGTDVAVVLDLMIHDLDLILTLMGEFPSTVEAAGVAVISEGVDIANARLTFPSGGVANVTASRISANPMRKLRMFAADSYISLDFASGGVQVFRLAKADEEHIPGTTSLGEIEKAAIKRHILFSQPQAPEGNAIEMEQQAFFRAIAEGTPPPVSGEQGLNALRLASQILDKIGASEIATGRD